MKLHVLQRFGRRLDRALDGRDQRAGRIRVGSKIAKGAKLICADCQGKWDLLKKSAEMFRKEARESRNPFGGKNPFGDIFKDWGK